MIKLDIHDYCNDCDGFEPVFTPGDKLYHDRTDSDGWNCPLSLPQTLCFH